MWHSPRRGVVINMHLTTYCRYCRGLALAVGLLTFAVHALAQTMWPKIALPTDIKTFDIGGQGTTINGLPVHMQGFVSAVKPAQLAHWFRQSLGKPLVENNLDNKLILGRVQGEHYLTVQMENAGTGTRGLIAVTHLKAAYDSQTEFQATTERWLSRLPSGSRLLSQMTSQDGGKFAKHLVIVNTYSEDLNRDRLKSAMREEGLELEREAQADGKVASALPGNIANGKTLFFKGQGKQAIAVIYRDDLNRTAIVLNTVNSLERLK